MLSILICTLPERKKSFSELMIEIYSQIKDCDCFQDVEIIFDNTKRGALSTGEKRNRLKVRAKKKYIWFVDDDDMILPGAIKAILQAAETDCDCMSINGFMTYDGQRQTRWEIAIHNPYCADWSTGTEVYLRYPNHITPIKRELVHNIMFPEQNNFEDKAFADSVKDSEILKTETKIDIPIYHYRFSKYNKTY